jgi:hypothetical protein
MTIASHTFAIVIFALASVVTVLALYAYPVRLDDIVKPPRKPAAAQVFINTNIIIYLYKCNLFS